MRYIDAGYAAALGVMFVYAVSLMVRRRRWDRALKVARSGEDREPLVADGTAAPVVPGGRP